MSALQEEIAEAVRTAIKPLAQRIEELSHKLAVQSGEADDRWVSVKEASTLAGRDEKTIRRWIGDGLVETRRIGPNGGRIQVREQTLARRS